MFYAFLSKLAGAALIVGSLLFLADSIRLPVLGVHHHLHTQTDLFWGVILFDAGRLIYGLTTVIYIGGSRRFGPYYPARPVAPTRQIVEHIHRVEHVHRVEGPIPNRPLDTTPTQVINGRSTIRAELPRSRFFLPWRRN